ncbi:glutathionylspermidine synthase family protein, partial [Escherichia coli]
MLVFEPLWTVIPGNKAILPILWSLFPHHRYLLDTD